VLLKVTLTQMRPRCAHHILCTKSITTAISHFGMIFHTFRQSITMQHTGRRRTSSHMAVAPVSVPCNSAADASGVSLTNEPCFEQSSELRKVSFDIIGAREITGAVMVNFCHSIPSLDAGRLTGLFLFHFPAPTALLFYYSK
jgi:hypothetical protein